ncbi:MAG: hypothetical protein IKI94_08465, partial [Ruminococcus sp.]|nr:hypothetical protein [Ruminococcus sp.]
MAKLCELCGKRNNPFVGDAFYLNDDKFLCCHCAKHIREDINNLYYVKTQEDCEFLKNKIISTSEQYYNDLITTFIVTRIDKICEQLVFEEGAQSSIYNNSGVNGNIGPFENQDLVYTIDGVRGRHIDIYTDKVVITTKVTIGSLLTNNATDGEKTIYYSDCIGVQFKQSKFAIGYLQLETASSNGNNKGSNFFAENSFTFDTTVISNERMIEVADYVKSRVDAVKKGSSTPVSTNNSNVSVADELL